MTVIDLDVEIPDPTPCDTVVPPCRMGTLLFIPYSYYGRPVTRD